MPRTSISTARRSFRRLAVATLVASTAVAGSAAAASAAVHKTDEVAFAGKVYLTPQADGSSKAVLVADSCTLKADGGPAKACSFVVYGTIKADGSGSAKAVLTTSDRVIVMDETFVATGPTTGLGTGTAKEIGINGVKSATFTAPFQLAPTSNPNVLLDWGTITITH